jgi:ribosomal RNA-processing protein 12
MSRLLKGFCSNSALHKEMLAVLAAVTEVIKTNGGRETTVEYLGALVSLWFISNDHIVRFVFQL